MGEEWTDLDWIDRRARWETVHTSGSITGHLDETNAPAWTVPYRLTRTWEHATSLLA
ncbi:hypothetical protein PS9374_04645 [Planomonospora sphaerica]|uniref:Uncharacterized protein n=1 Tax=Planomonospora sphaerica TaxID=161355 RepID=A0A171DJG9_9ACTN|nr:hypothetical protein [Planomonospora sphaerica]GAT68980.1 hypothetical protein PS9374_04645 [Planomonospora sphaerica]